MRFMLGAILIVLGVFKLRDLIETDYPFGATLTIVLVVMWIAEIIKEAHKGRK